MKKWVKIALSACLGSRLARRLGRLLRKRQ